MTFEEFESLMESEEADNEYLEFQNVKNPLSTYPDVHALIVLSLLLPNNGSCLAMFSGVRYEELWLSIDCELLAEKLTRDQALDLVRSGVLYCPDRRYLYMNV